MNIEKLKAVGTLIITLTDENGQIKEQTVTPNLVVDGGKTAIAQALYQANTAPYFTYMTLGTGVTAAQYYDTLLATETAAARVTGSTAVAAAVSGSGATLGTWVGNWQSGTPNQITYVSGSTTPAVGHVVTVGASNTITVPAGTVIISYAGGIATLNNALSGTTNATANWINHATSTVYSWTWGPNVPVSSGSTAVTESGIFNNATINSGTMLSRVVFSAVNKQGGLDTLNITWIVSVT
jgi:hypothetical protein